MSRIDKLKEMRLQQPDDNFLKHALALEIIKTGDDAAARSLFESILSRDPSYVGSYYHLGKLLERLGDTEAAIKIYEQGMSECKKMNDMHALNELRGAYDDLTT